MEYYQHHILLLPWFDFCQWYSNAHKSRYHSGVIPHPSIILLVLFFLLFFPTVQNSFIHKKNVTILKKEKKYGKTHTHQLLLDEYLKKEKIFRFK